MPADIHRRDVELAARGDHEAFERLYRGSASRIYGLALRMAGESVAEDLTQEVFIRAWTKLPTFRGEARFTTWLHRLAVNLILTRRATIKRRREKQVAGEGLMERMAGRSATPGLRMDFDAALETLPEGARQIFVLYDVEGYSHREIAETMDISEGTSKSQLHRARMLLRKYLT